MNCGGENFDEEIRGNEESLGAFVIIPPTPQVHIFGPCGIGSYIPMLRYFGSFGIDMHQLYD